MKKLWIIAIICLSSMACMAQGRGGASVYYGITHVISQDKNFTPEGQQQTGYHFGLDARLFSGTMFFGGGLEYHIVSLLPIENTEYFSPKTTLGIAKLRGGLGFNLFQITQKVVLRAKTYGTFNFNASYDAKLSEEKGFEYVGAYAGAIGGLGLDIGAITLDFDYEYGLVNAVSDQKDSKMDFYKLSVGIFF